MNDKILPHVDEECDWIAHVHWPRYPIPAEAVARPDLHEALGGREGEDHGVSCVGSDMKAGYMGQNGGGNHSTPPRLEERQSIRR